jgi:hypothetical protein
MTLLTSVLMAYLYRIIADHEAVSNCVALSGPSVLQMVVFPDNCIRCYITTRVKGSVS